MLVLLASLTLVAAPLAAAGSSASTGDSEISITDVTLVRSTISPGDAASIRVTVANTGDASGSRSLQLTGDGRAYVQTLVRLDGGERRTVTFDQAFESPGEYDLAVDGVSAGTLTVSAATTTDSTGRTEPGPDRGPEDGVTLTAWVLILVLGGALGAGLIYFARVR